MLNEIEKMTIRELLELAEKKDIDVSSIHTGNSFRQKNKKTYGKEDLVKLFYSHFSASKDEQSTNDGDSASKDEQSTNDGDSASKDEQLTNDGDSASKDEQLTNDGDSASKDEQSINSEKLADFDNFHDMIEHYAHIYYEKLNEYCLSLLANNTAFLPIFFNLVSSYGDDIKNHVYTVKKHNDISANTLKNYHSQIMILIENKVLKNNYKFPDNLLQKSFKTFSDSVKNLFSIEFKSAIKSTGEHLNERQNDIIFLECKELILFAKNTLINLSDKAIAWKEIALALMIVTGRRLTEIMFSAEFTKIDDYTVNFIGQLKGVKYDIKGYAIPTLVKSDLVINGMQWLKIFGKRNNVDFIDLVKNNDLDRIKLENKKTHGKYARYLNEEIKVILTNYVKLEDNGQWIIKFNDSKEKDRRTTHICRQIYAQIAYNFFYYRNKVARKKHQILADILGHEYSSEKSKSASNNYDADFEITDYDAIAEIIKYS